MFLDAMSCLLMLQALEQMQAASIRPDTAAYAAVIDLLWSSGIVGAQQRAQQLFQLACRQSVRGMEAVQHAAAQDDSDTLEVTKLAQCHAQAAMHGGCFMAELLRNQHTAQAVWCDTPFACLSQLTTIPSLCLANERISVLVSALHLQLQLMSTVI